jgi:MFS family permease
MVSNTGNWLTNVALTLLVLHITDSGLAVGVLAAFSYGPILFLSAWGGAISDRVNKRHFLFLTQSLEMVESAGLAVLAFMPHPPLAGLYALALGGGVLLAFDNPLRRSFVSEMVPKEDVPNAVVLYSTVVNTSRIFGPALAGLLVVTVGYGWCFTVDALSYLAVIFSLYRMRPTELHREPSKPRMKGEIRAGLRYVAETPSLWVSFAMLAAIGTLAYNFNVTLPLFVTDTLHSSATTFTILYSIFSCGAVIGALFVANRGLVRMRHIIMGAAALGVAMLVLATTTKVATASPVMFFVGVGSILYTTATTTMVQVEAKPEVRGRVLALQMAGSPTPSAAGRRSCSAASSASSRRFSVISLRGASFGLSSRPESKSIFMPYLCYPIEEFAHRR